MKQGWEVKRLGEVCEQITDGSHFSPKSSSDDKYPYITVRDIENDQIDFTNCKFIGENEYQSLLKNGCKPNFGDILFSKDGTVGKVSLVNFERDFVVLSSLAIIRPKKDNIFSPLLKYILKDPAFLEKAIGMKTGVAIKRIILKNLKLIEIYYPKSLPEQQRIVAILDEAFAAIAKAKANAEQNLRNAKELFESYLQSVFENKGEGWVEKTLGEIAFVKSGGTPSRSKKEYWEGNIAWYSSGELNEVYTKDPERHINELALNNSNAKLFPKGSLLIGMYDTAALKMSITNRDAAFNQAIAGVKPSDKIDLIFIFHSINSIKPNLLNLRRGVRQKNLSLGKIKNIPISLPSLNVQQTIVQKLDALSAETKKLEVIYQQKINDLEELKKSILHKAFSGELNTDKDIAA